MKYFTVELLDKSYNLNDPEFEVIDKIWMKNVKEYWDGFSQYEFRLPAEFVTEYYKYGFHDYRILSINLYNDETKENNCYVIELKICFDSDVLTIKYIDVIKFNTSFNFMNSITENILLYNEILPVDDKVMSHEMILVDRNNIYIEFKKLTFNISANRKLWVLQNYNYRLK